MNKFIYKAFSWLFVLFGVFTGTSLYAWSECFHVADTTFSKNVGRTVYGGNYKTHRAFYNRMWGVHYRPIYYIPVDLETVELKTLYGGLDKPKQMSSFCGLLLEDKDTNYYLLKRLGGINSFAESSFFHNIYDPKEFSKTYIGDFIDEAYTIQHPYMPVVSAHLARSSGLYSGNTRFYHISPSVKDTVSNGEAISDRLVSISEVPNPDSDSLITSVDDLFDKLHNQNNSHVDKKLYIRTRLLDLLIGDWNKIPENWNWLSHQKGDSVVFEPIVLDRSYAFTKVDGFAFRQILNMLGLDFIVSYESTIKNLKKANKLGYALDVALLSECEESMWIEQAQILQGLLTDELIDEAFSDLPPEIQNDVSNRIRSTLKIRKSELENIATDYFRHLQKTPVVVGANRDQRFVVDRLSLQETKLSIYDIRNDLLAFERVYDRKITKEIWIYALDGHDKLEVVGDHNGGIPIAFIGGKGLNEYDVKRSRNLTIYEGKSQRKEQVIKKRIPNAKVIVPSDSSVLEYDYTKLKYSKFKVTPIGIYDSDLGLSIGTSVSYTIYGFKRSPFSSQHQLSFNYNEGFIYQGIFPDFNAKKSFHLSAFLGSPRYFSNFFGFGNNTGGYKDEKKEFNRVKIKKYAITPGFYYTINKDQEVNFSTSFEMYNVERPEDENNFISQVYSDANTYKAKYFANMNVAYVLDKKINDVFSNLELSINPGWIVNLGNPERSFAYVKSSLGANVKLTDRLTFATLIKNTVLFSDQYEFYQAATTELRGFRDNRFLGKQSLYQYSDFRYDMGRIQNPLTPLAYGIFVGSDHGRVWYSKEYSKQWHTSYGGGFWLTLFNKFTGKFSYFASRDTGRFTFDLGLVF